MRVVPLSILLLATLASACPNIPFCRECSKPVDKQARICKTCNFSYFDETTLKCVTEISATETNCNQYAKDGDKIKCVSCEFGYRLSADNKCVKCSGEHCAICDKDLKCIACFWGIEVKDGFCDAKNKCALDNCQVCQMNADKKDFKCAMCTAGFALSEHGECLRGSENCLVADPDESAICSKCKSGFYLDEKFLCKANTPTPTGGNGAAWLVFLLLLALIGVAFYYRSKKRSGAAYTKVNAEDYVTVN